MASITSIAADNASNFERALDPEQLRESLDNFSDSQFITFTVAAAPATSRYQTANAVSSLWLNSHRDFTGCPHTCDHQKTGAKWSIEGVQNACL
jgi:5,10-methylenetetrahydrofolate reductase